MIHVHLETCQSTQDEVRARLTDAASGAVVSVSSDKQLAGRGREGRSWETPPGAVVLLSVGLQGPVSVDVLDQLPRRVADATIAVVSPDGATPGLVWRAPNDLVDAAGAKLAGILVDARTTAGVVDHVVVGLGLNVGGDEFVTSDGRSATTLQQLTGAMADVHELRDRLAAAIAQELTVSD